VSQVYWDAEVYMYIIEIVIPASSKTIKTTAVTAAEAVYNEMRFLKCTFQVSFYINIRIFICHL